jgi:glycosyltransferase involved in cell wall biosynthesis
MITAWTALALAAGLAAYAYGGYPLLVLVVGRLRANAAPPTPPTEWPFVSIVVPVYNEEATIAATIDSLIRLDYPRDRVEIMVVSDASTDGTDAIVQTYQTVGVELIRAAERGGKTVAENLARRHSTGEIIVNTDASVHVPPQSLKPLVAAFADPTIAVASGRDVSVASAAETGNRVEAGYVGYEMWVRGLETRAGGIIGGSGCFFATRAGVLDANLPPGLSWDFAAPLLARERGYRSVSVPDAVCHVPRTTSVAREYRRKVRTIARGIRTLYHKRNLLNPFRYGLFSWMLFSHKVCRWLLPWGALVAVAAIAAMAAYGETWARLALVGGMVLVAAGVVGWSNERAARLRPLSMAAFLLAGNLAVIHAAFRAMASGETATWEPTRREYVPGTAAGPKG